MLSEAAAAEQLLLIWFTFSFACCECVCWVPQQICCECWRAVKMQKQVVSFQPPGGSWWAKPERLGGVGFLNRSVLVLVPVTLCYDCCRTTEHYRIQTVCLSAEVMPVVSRRFCWISQKCSELSVCMLATFLLLSTCFGEGDH